jgi:cyclase
LAPSSTLTRTGTIAWGNQLVEGASIVSSRAAAEEMRELPPRRMTALVGAAARVARFGQGTRLGPAHTKGDLLVHLPKERVVFTGDILFVGSHPIVWEGPISNWIAACDRILALDPAVVVPGLGRSPMRAV